MNERIVIALVILIVIIVLGIIMASVLWKQKKEGKVHEANYFAFFVLGICWLPIGIVFITRDSLIGYTFFILGAVYLIVGLAKRDTWKKG